MAYQQSFAGSRTSHDRTRASTVAPGATRAVDPMRLTRFMDQQHGGTNLMMVSPRRLRLGKLNTAVSQQARK
jgi:hypothetical protein